MQRVFFFSPDWQQRGTYYIGFRLDTGAGAQYGWVRVRWFGFPSVDFTVKDYAWGDPGDQIKTGQRKLHDDDAPTPPSVGSADAISPANSKGSLGLLALGAVGLAAWRRSRVGKVSFDTETR